MTNQDIAKQIIESEEQIQTSFDDLNKAAIELANAAKKSASSLYSGKGGAFMIILGLVLLVCVAFNDVCGIIGFIIIICGVVYIFISLRSGRDVEDQVSNLVDILNKEIDVDNSASNSPTK